MCRKKINLSLMAPATPASPSILVRFLCRGLRCWEENIGHFLRFSCCLVLSPKIQSTARCGLANIRCIAWESPGSLRRCLLLGRRTGSPTRGFMRSGHHGCAKVVLLGLYLFFPESRCWEQLELGWRVEGLGLEGCPDHCQSICVNCFQVWSPAYVLRKLGG